MPLDSSFLRNPGQSLLGALMSGYQEGNEAVEQRRRLQAEKQQAEAEAQQQIDAADRKGKFNRSLSSIMGNYGKFAGTPEGKQAIFQELSKAGFGNEALSFFGGIPAPEKKKYEKAETEQGFTSFDPDTGEYGRIATDSAGIPYKKPEKKPSAFEIAKDEWERNFKQKQADTSNAERAANQKFREAQLATSNAEREAVKKYREAQLALEQSRTNSMNEVRDEEKKAKEFKLAQDKIDRQNLAIGAKDEAERGIAIIDKMIGSEDRAVKQHPGFKAAVGAKGISSFFGAKSEPVQGTDAADFAIMLEQIKGASFKEAVQSLRGTGQITEKEGLKATAAINRMSRAQSEGAFRQAAREVQQILKNRKDVATSRLKGSTPMNADNNPLGLEFLTPMNADNNPLGLEF
jgi:hypothetical protein